MRTLRKLCIQGVLQGAHRSKLGLRVHTSKDANEFADCKLVPLKSELFNVAINDFCAKKSAVARLNGTC